MENSKCEEDIRVSYPRPESDDMLGVVTALETDGKQLRRHFRPVRGSAISIILDRFPGIRSMMGGTLDDKNKDEDPLFAKDRKALCARSNAS
jgi:hypothetical protein